MLKVWRPSTVNLGSLGFLNDRGITFSGFKPAHFKDGTLIWSSLRPKAQYIISMDGWMNGLWMVEVVKQPLHAGH
jgi:hypothetical protein